MLRAALSAVFIAAAVNSALAWEVHENINRMTDKKESWITLHAKPITRLGQSVSPYIEVSCYKGKPFPQLKFDRPVEFGRVGVNFRFDHEKIRQRISSFFNDGMTLPIFLGNESDINSKLKNSKQLRLEVFFTGQQATYIEFDVTAGKDFYSRLKC